jgi:hypothetical protein
MDVESDIATSSMPAEGENGSEGED